MMRLISGILLAYVTLLGLYFVVPYLIRIILKKRFLLSIERDGRICLTFDDGPSPESTPEILELLEKLGIKATFFLVGENIEKHPELAREILKQGHEIGDHGYRHIHCWACFPFGALIDLIRGSMVIKKKYKIKSDFYLRPPYGKLNLITLCYVLLCGRKIAFWNVNPKDYISQSPDEITKKVLEQITGGSVILLHERPFKTDPNIRGNLVAIKMIVAYLKNCGYTFATVNEAVTSITLEKHPYVSKQAFIPKNKRMNDHKLDA